MFHLIDFDNWERAEIYNHFMNNCKCNYNITANLDLTKLKSVMNDKGLRLYPTMIYLVTKVVNSNYLFRMDIVDNKVGYHDLCHPSYTIPNMNPLGFAGIWSEYKEDFESFYNNCIKDIEEFSQSNIYIPKANQPQNTFYVSIMPTISFTSLDMNLYEGNETFSLLSTIGKYFEQGDKILIPFSMRFHHAVCDGKHVGEFYNTLQQIMDEFQG